MAGKFFFQYLVIALALIVLLAGCKHDCYNHYGRSGYLKVLQSSPEGKKEQSEKFKSFAISEQIDVYLFSKQCVEGGGEFTDFVVQDGSKKVLAILERIKNNSKNDEKAWLIEALVAVNDDCKCVTNYSNALEILSEAENAEEENDTEMTKMYKRIYSINLAHIRNKQAK